MRDPKIEGVVSAASPNAPSPIRVYLRHLRFKVLVSGDPACLAGMHQRLPRSMLCESLSVPSVTVRVTVPEGLSWEKGAH